MKLKVYISKSNQANPDTLIFVRELLKKHNVEVVEYSGGKYSSKPLGHSDVLVCISYPGAKEEDIVLTGKGIFSEVEKSLLGRIPSLYTNGDSFFFVKGCEINDLKDFQRKFGKLYLEKGEMTRNEFLQYLDTVSVRENKEDEEDDLKFV